MVTRPDGRMPEIGESAPYFVGKTSFGDEVSLWSYRGKYLVLYFFPKAHTPGCTKQTRLFRDNYPEIKELGAEVLGVSLDDLDTQCDFAAGNAVTFPLLGDKSRAVSEAYGVVRSLLQVDKRVTFVIDPAGKVVQRFHHEFQVSKHLDDVLTYLRGLRPAEGERAS